MQFSELKDIKPTRVTHGRPSHSLTDKKWQEEFEFLKLYITPCKNPTKRMGGKYSRGNYSVKEDEKYEGITNWQAYCSYINDILKVITSGKHDFCYYGYQIVDLLKFHPDKLQTKYLEQYRCWEVWLEK